MAQYLRNKLRQEHRRDRMMSGGDQNCGNVESVRLRKDQERRWLGQSTVILCETSLLLATARQLGLCVAGEVRATSTEMHANDSDGSSGDESEASLERGMNYTLSRERRM